MAKRPTPQGVSALLKKTGFTRSESHPSRIRGMREQSYGFKVARYREDGVSVKHMPGFARGAAAQVREHEMLTAYAKAIEAAGYRVQQDQVGFSQALIVTAGEAAQ